MRRTNLLRSSPFRLGIAFALMVVATFAATGFAVSAFMRWELYKHQDQTISETYSVIANAYGDSDLTDLLETVETNVRATNGLQRIFLVRRSDGTVLGGNIPALDLPPGWSTIKGARIGAEPDLAYRVFAGSVDGIRLVVGSSRQEIDSLQEILASSFALGDGSGGLAGGRGRCMARISRAAKVRRRQRHDRRGLAGQARRAHPAHRPWRRHRHAVA